MERRHTNRPAQVEARGDGKQYITGHGIVFYRDGDPSTEYVLWDDEGGKAVERVHPDFANRALQERHDVRALFNHDSSKLLGRSSSGTLVLTKDSVGLRYDIPYDENDGDHRDVKAKMDRGDLNGSSFAFQAKAKWDRADDGTEIRWLMDGDLFDIGPVTYPAYGGTTAGMRAVSDVTDIRSERDQWAGKRDERQRMQIEMQRFLLEVE